MTAASSSPAPAAVRALLRRFRAQRPLRGGSLLITIFGDAIAPRGAAVTLGSLIRLAAPFGLTERLVRTSVARLAGDGWLSARRSGRRSEYRLTRSGAARFAEATRRIYGENPSAWSGKWTLLLVPPGRSPRLLRAREELEWLGFGRLSPSLYAHPGCDPELAGQWLRSLAGAADLVPDAVLLHASGTDLGSDRRLVSYGWDLEELGRRYRRFVSAFAPVASALRPGVQVAPDTAFVVRTLLIHEYRKIHLRDPLLPPPLLPADWVGSSAYELCRRLYARVFAPAETYLSATARRLDRPLPAAGAAARARFGGLGRERSRQAQ
jgi:phenylacetic acid degradation operon negative regulatory protein